MLVIQKCEDWIEIESDKRVGGSVRSFTGWAYFPMTCTPKWRVRGNRYRNTGPLIAPECSFE